MLDPSMNSHALNRLRLESALRKGLTREEFVVHYQPIISVETGKVLSLEALVRWDHPERGLVSPSEFIPVAEDIGLMVDIGRRVLKEACSQIRQWQDSYPSDPPLRAHINLSARQFYEPDLVCEIAEVLAETNLDPRSLELEITENVTMEDVPATLAIMGALKSLGVGLAIDDFGTGYSSLAYLKRFPVDTLKIDGSFVAGLGNSTSDEVIVAAIIELAQGFGLTTIPEMVETTEQLQRLREMGCDMIQGFCVSQPLPTEAVGTMLRRNLQYQ
jgi:Amt family ammonium transporter